MNTKVTALTALSGPSAIESPDRLAQAAHRVELAQLSAVSYSNAGMLSEQARDQICEALAGADLPIFDSVRKVWGTKYRDETGCTVAASDTAWSKFCKEFAIEKPKATTAEAKRKDAERTAERAALDALPTDRLNALKAEAVEAAKASLAVNDLKGSLAAQKSAEKLNRAIVERSKEEGKAEHDVIGRKRKAIIERIKSANLETLNRIEALLDSAAPMQPASGEVERAIHPENAPLVQIDEQDEQIAA